MDLDDDELKATRIMNGSDKNVVSLKEDIEGLKRLFYANALTQYGKRKLIGYYEQQIKELEENSIPVSLVKEKIEEIDKEIEYQKLYGNVAKREKLETKKEHFLEILESEEVFYKNY